jgi:hypothetical protein
MRWTGCQGEEIPSLLSESYKQCTFRQKGEFSNDQIRGLLDPKTYSKTSLRLTCHPLCFQTPEKVKRVLCFGHDRNPGRDRYGMSCRYEGGRPG